MGNKIAVWKVITAVAGLREHYPNHEPPADGGPFLVVELDDRIVVFNLGTMRSVLEGYQEAVSEREKAAEEPAMIRRPRAHPVRAFRQQPRWRRVFGARQIYRIYREWDNGRWDALVLTWRAVVWR